MRIPEGKMSKPSRSRAGHAGHLYVPLSRLSRLSYARHGTSGTFIPFVPFVPHGKSAYLRGPIMGIKRRKPPKRGYQDRLNAALGSLDLPAVGVGRVSVFQDAN